MTLHDIRREWKERQAEIARNQLFFLYQAGKELQNRF
jgi:hypothetical protein